MSVLLTDADYDEDLLMAVEDSEVSFVLHSPGASTFDTESGDVTQGSTEYSVAGLVEELSELELQRGGHANLQAGDQLFMCRVADVGEGIAIDTRWWIVYNSTTLRIIVADIDPTERLWCLIGRAN